MYIGGDYTFLIHDDDDVIAFSASLYRQPTANANTTNEDDHGIYDSEYGYSGRGYVTQNRLWFYSCTLMTCVNTVSHVLVFLLLSRC